MNLDRDFSRLNKIFSILLLGLLFFANEILFVMSYLALFAVLSLRTWMTPGGFKTKFILFLAYCTVVILQIVFVVSVVFPATDSSWEWVRRIFALMALFLPLIVSRYVMAGKYAYFYLPSATEASTIGIANLSDYTQKLRGMATTVGTTRKKLSKDNLKAVTLEIARNDSFKYINNGSLTDAYFKQAETSLSDENIYLVISHTGSSASEIISVFTQKQYNHASLSFDADLQTTISYNGGERVYPPGLNLEMVEFFSKSPDASILVYSLPVTAEKKLEMIEKIAEINREGSAYNMLGLVFKRSYKPNIMFCSQFVYNMLEQAGLAYFTKSDGKVSPTDLVELDYYKKLKFEREIKF